MFHLHLFPAQQAHQLDAVVSRDAQSFAGLDHIADNADTIQSIRATVYQIAIAPRVILRPFDGFHVFVEMFGVLGEVRQIDIR